MVVGLSKGPSRLAGETPVVGDIPPQPPSSTRVPGNSVGGARFDSDASVGLARARHLNPEDLVGPSHGTRTGADRRFYCYRCRGESPPTMAPTDQLVNHDDRLA